MDISPILYCFETPYPTSDLTWHPCTDTHTDPCTELVQCILYLYWHSYWPLYWACTELVWCILYLYWHPCTVIPIILIKFFYLFYIYALKYISYLFYSHMKKHTTVMCVEHHLEGKMYLQNTRRLMKMESEKKAVIHHHHPPAKKQRIAEHYECNICSASFENVQELKDHFSNPSRKQWRWGISWSTRSYYGESIQKCT